MLKGKRRGGENSPRVWWFGCRTRIEEKGKGRGKDLGFLRRGVLLASGGGGRGLRFMRWADVFSGKIEGKKKKEGGGRSQFGGKKKKKKKKRPFAGLHPGKRKEKKTPLQK